MKRIIVAVISLAIAITICFIGYFSVDSSCKKIEENLLNICTLAQNEEVEKSIKESQTAIDLWESSHGLIESFIRHEETDKLEELIKSLPVYAKQGNMERLEQQADLAIDELHHLIRSEKPLISNIF